MTITLLREINIRIKLIWCPYNTWLWNFVLQKMTITTLWEMYVPITLGWELWTKNKNRSENCVFPPWCSVATEVLYLTSLIQRLTHRHELSLRLTWGLYRHVGGRTTASGLSHQLFQPWTRHIRSLIEKFKESHWEGIWKIELYIQRQNSGYLISFLNCDNMWHTYLQLLFYSTCTVRHWHHRILPDTSE